MIIDCHVHIFIPGMIPQAYVDGVRRTLLMHGKRLGMDLAAAEEMVWPLMLDPKGETYMEIMNTAGIDKAVLFGVDFGEEIGEPEIPVFEMNRLYSEIVRAHPDRFVALCAIDPRREGAMEHVTRCVEEWDMRGVKLHPSAGFNPMDPVMFPLYEKCAQWDLPLVIHSGAQPSVPLKLDVCRPVYIAEAASRFPDTKIVLAHLGMEWWNEALMFGRFLPNLYFDYSYWQVPFGRYSEEFYTILRKFVDDCGAERVLWGTDTPLPNLLMPPIEWLDATLNPRADVRFSEDEKRMMTGENAKELFKF